MITLKKFIKEVVDELSEIQIQDLDVISTPLTSVDKPRTFNIIIEHVHIDPNTFDVSINAKNIEVEDLEYNVIIVLKPNTTDVIKVMVEGENIDKELLTKNEDDSLLVALESNRELASKIKRPIYSLTK